MLLPPLVRVEGDAAAPVGGGFLQNIALRALDDVPGGSTAVLSRHADGPEAVVIHGQDAAGVDAALDVGGVVHLIRLPEQAHHVADVVHVQVHQCAARAGRVKGSGGLPGAECVVPAGILAEVALHQLHRADAGQQLPDLVVIFKVLGGHGFEQKDLFPPGQIGQLLGL